MKIKSTLCAVSVLLLPSCLLAHDRLEEVVIVASKTTTPVRQVGAAVTVIDRDEIALRGYASIADVLRTETGIHVSNAGGPGKATSIRVRGEEGYRTLVLIDGIEVSDPSTPQVTTQIQHITTSDDIERIEILRGPQGFVYGADAGGVVRIQTREPEAEATGQISAEGGRYNSTRSNAFISAGNKKFAGFVSLADLTTDGLNARSNDLSGERDGYDNTTAHAKLGWRISDAFSTQAVFRDVSADGRFDNCGFPSTNNCAESYDQQAGRLAVVYEGERSAHNFAVSQSDIERESLAAGISSFATQGKIEKVEYLGEFGKPESLRLVFGGDFRNEEIDVRDGDDLEREQTAAFVDVLGGVDKRLFINLGARFDDNEDFGQHTSLRMSAAWTFTLSDRLAMKLRGSAGNGFRAPSLSEIAYNNSDFAFGEAATIRLQEEKSSGREVGVEFHHENGVLVELGYFYQEISDEIFFDLVNFSGYLQAQGESESKGVEIGFDAPVAGSLSIQGNYTHNETQTTGKQVRLRRPEKGGNLGLKAHFLNHRINILLNVRFARDAEDEVFGVGRVDLDDYEVADLSARYRLSTGLEIYSRIENINDADYQEVVGFNTAGRAVYGGARYTF